MEKQKTSQRWSGKTRDTTDDQYQGRQLGENARVRWRILSCEVPTFCKSSPTEGALLQRVQIKIRTNRYVEHLRSVLVCTG